MSVTIPLHYYNQQIGYTRVDPVLGELSATFRLGIVLPTSVFREHHNRPDIVLARLKDPHDLLPRCYPVVPLRFFNQTKYLRLARVALRPSIVSQLNKFLTDQSNYELYQNIMVLYSSVSRVIFLDQDRTNLVSANLRELVSDIV